MWLRSRGSPRQGFDRSTSARNKGLPSARSSIWFDGSRACPSRSGGRLAARAIPPRSSLRRHEPVPSSAGRHAEVNSPSSWLTPGAGIHVILMAIGIGAPNRPKRTNVGGGMSGTAARACGASCPTRRTFQPELGVRESTALGFEKLFTHALAWHSRAAPTPIHERHQT